MDQPRSTQRRSEVCRHGIQTITGRLAPTNRGAEQQRAARQSAHTDFFSLARMRRGREGELAASVEAHAIVGNAQGLSRTR